MCWEENSSIYYVKENIYPQPKEQDLINQQNQNLFKFEETQNNNVSERDINVHNYNNE